MRRSRLTDYKSHLKKLNENFNILKEREAKYAGNAPLDLLNQMKDHEQAIDLTRQVITGEISEAEWQEALKPLLLAVSNGQVVNIEAETYIAGDQIITHIYEAPPPPLPPAEVKERRELAILLNKVKTFWIEGVLEKSVHNVALIDLNKETQAEAVAHAWEQVLELPDQSRQTLPPHKKISQIFEEMNRALLILGEPGCGKTITLLQLTRDLIGQAEQDKNFAQPIPVVFNLSSWREEELLLDWLVAELSAKYQIPKRIGQSWLKNNRLLPLLDGLDEVKPNHRAHCVELINQFGTEFGLSGLAVCSRLEEYTNLPVRLKLNGAIRLQPLTLEQVYDYLEVAGSKLDALRVALKEDNSLQTLAQTPLTLGIMSLAYQDMSAEVLIGQANTLVARRKHLFDTYIERMFKRKGQDRRSFPDNRTQAWLSWLAQGMIRHNQGIFLIEQLQPSWLASRGYTWAYVLGSRLIGGLFGGLMFSLIMGVSGARLVGIRLSLLNGLDDWLVLGLITGVIIGLLWGLIEGVQFEQRAKNVALGMTPTRWQRGINILGVGLILGVSSGLIFGFYAGLLFGLVGGLLFGLVGGVALELRGRRQNINNDIQTVEALQWSWEQARRIAPVGLLGGVVLGLTLALILQLDQELVNRVQDGPISGLLGEPGFVVGMGLFWGVFAGVMVAMIGGLSSKLEETKTRPNQGVWLSARNALLTGPGFGLIIGLVGGLLGGVMFGWRNGLDFGLAIGLGMGTFAVLWYGGLDIIKHYTLRFIFWYQGHIPRDYIRFLDYAADRIFLQKVGGGYMFIHRLLLEHFAAMNETRE